MCRWEKREKFGDGPPRKQKAESRKQKAESRAQKAGKGAEAAASGTGNYSFFSFIVEERASQTATHD
jgi:hypothetical protein